MIKNAGQLIAAAQKKIECLDAEQAKAMYDATPGAVILDVREADSAAKSKLNDSINISRGLLEMTVPGKVEDPNTLILCHCGGGGRASLAAATLTEMGYARACAITARYEDIKTVFD